LPGLKCRTVRVEHGGREQRRRGIFVTFEGVEGCGKSTQARALEGYLTNRGIPARLTREPGGTALGEALRHILLDHGNAGMLPETELFLYLAARAEHVAQVIAPLLDSGVIVISDRFGDASVAYQGGGRDLDPRVIETLNNMATRSVKPDVTFLLDLDPEEGLSRLSRAVDDSGAAVERDRIESETLGFHGRVRAAYLDTARREPSRFMVIDARRSMEDIASAVVGRVSDLLKARGWPDEEG
jgi:dTMP kinase